MSHANKIMGAVALFAAVLTFLLLLAGVISTDAYSTAAQAQANGDLVLMHLTMGDTDAAHVEKATSTNQVVTQ